MMKINVPLKRNESPAVEMYRQTFGHGPAIEVVQIPISGRGGQDSGGGGLGGQALRPVEGSPQDGDRDTSGRTLRETPALDIREDQKYLYQKPQGVMCAASSRSTKK